MTKEDITTLQKVVSCIPQVYFDIIGRVIPGTLIMGSIWIAVRGPEEFWKSLKICLVKATISSATVAIFLVLLTSYTVAILLWCVWSCVIVKICYKRKKSRIMRMFRKKMYWDNEGFRMKYETLKYYNIAAGNRITKLKAQIHMTETLFVGLPLSCLFGIITYISEVVTYFCSFTKVKLEIPSLSPRFVSWTLILLAAVCSLFARQYFISHMNDSLKNNLELLKQEEMRK